MRFIHISDLHVIPRGDMLHGVNPVGNLQKCVADINQFAQGGAGAPAAQFCVFTGDLVDRGDSESYQVLREILADLSLPYHLMLGNHDRREAFFDVFPEYTPDAAGFMQYTIETQAGILVFIDTLENDTHAGAYCEQRQRWLADTLAAHQGKAIFLFLHHPPLDIYLPGLDSMQLAQSQELLEIIKPHDIRHMFFGHVHKALGGNWHGIPFSSVPSTVHQIATDFDRVSPMPYCLGPPAYAFVDVDKNATVINLHHFLHQHPQRLADAWSS
jgi:Icc protein